MNVWDDQVLPHREPEFAFAIVGGEFSQRVHLFRSHSTNGNTDAEGVEAGLRLASGAEPAVLDNRASWFAGFGG